MSNQSDIIEIYNDDYSTAGTMPRKQAQNEGRWVRVSHLWIINPSLKTVLFQKRSHKKKFFPGTLDITAAGHYKAGEEIPSGVKEMSDELGITIYFENLIPLGIRHNIIPTPELTVQQFCHVFLLESARDISDFKLDPETTEGLVAISIDNGLKLWSDETQTTEANFLETKSKMEKTIAISKKQFLPRVDPYYYKIFILTKRFLKGEKYLVI